MIRRAVRGDLPQLAEIETQAFDSDRLSRRSLARHVGSPSAALLVAEDGKGTLAAYALVLFRRLSSIARLYSVASTRARATPPSAAIATTTRTMPTRCAMRRRFSWNIRISIVEYGFERRYMPR
jgi:ribosomal-protein-alanine N-acetyltransferase